MSTKYPGGIISKTAPTPSGPYADSTAPGVWTLEQQAYWQKLGQWPTAGNQDPANIYIEYLFSTYLYTGTSATQTINNGIDLAGKGGLVWCKERYNGPGLGHYLFDSARGLSQALQTESTNAQANRTTSVNAFSASGFSMGSSGVTNNNGTLYASWTFRKQPKFFDVVTYTGTGSARTIAHNLGSVPGCIIVKRTDSANDWWVYHRSLGNEKAIYLDLTNAAAFDSAWNNTDPTSTVFSVGSSSNVNASGGSFVAYLFAHDAGGFGLTGTDNVITCGSFTTDGSGNATVSLGYEPQWVLQKIASGGITSGVDDWKLLDTMRGFTNPSSGDVQLKPNTSDAEQNTSWGVPTATGFTFSGFANATYIYIAIRRGPMKVPTDGTTVFDVGTRSGSGSVAKTNSDILTDLAVIKRYTSAAEYWAWTPRLVGSLTLQSNSTDAELSGAMATNPWDTMTGAFCAASNGATNTSTLVDYSFRRAPGFHDEVCYTGTGSALTVNHNLGVAPELIITKRRNSATDWYVYCQYVSSYNTAYTQLNATNQFFTNGAIAWNATSTTYNASTFLGLSTSGGTYVSYLFATCAGVSKVGSYTGTGTTLQVNCGFTGGARFVMIKRTDSGGDWYVWDSARGIVAGNDPYLLLNSTAAEVTSTDYVDTYSAGFEISSTAPSAINASGGTFIFLAIA